MAPPRTPGEQQAAEAHQLRHRGACRAARARERPAALLQVERLNTFYGKSHVITDASLSVREGEIVALLGRNGAGKSTFLKSIIGIADARGELTLGSEALAGRSAAAIARLGVGYVPQGRALFAGMSVRHNLELGRLKRGRPGSGAWSDEKIVEFFPRLRPADAPANFLSGGGRQMVAVARSIGALRVLLLDEPFEGLAPAVIEELFEAFDKLRQEISMVIVEHNLDLVLALADHAYVLERGSVVHHGPAADLRDNLDLRRSVLWM
jgi:ABC-type branched-subunit amino acid transport system ATPase component